MHDIILDGKQDFDIDEEESEKKPRRRKNSGSGLTYWFELLSGILIVFCLLGTDFILFASSGPFSIFQSGGSLQPQVLYILIALLVLTAVVCFFFSALNILLNLLIAMTVYLFSIAVFNQFANFNTEAVSGWQSGNYISVVLAVIAFGVLTLTKKMTRAFICLAVVFCFAMVLLKQSHGQPEFAVKEEGVAAHGETEGRLINIMLPNAAAYSYISHLKDSEAGIENKKKLMAIMLGFYAQNGFKIYPNAYVTNNNPFVNAGHSLNYGFENIQDFLQNQVMKSSHWQFSNRQNFEVYLKQNQMVADFKEKKYQINAYQSRGINLCSQDNRLNVYRCVSKINQPANLDTLKLSTAEKTEILLAQWLESTGWLKKGMNAVYDRLKSFYNPDKTPIIGMSYQNLYVLNSLKTINILMEDLAKDKGNNAYFVYLDMPADMYIYDELCRLKGTDEWIAKDNLPWVEKSSPVDRRNAYIQQSLCIYGKLEQLLHTLRKNGQFDQTTIIIQGLNGLADLNGNKDKSIADDFMNGQMTALAIKGKDNKQLVINKSVCPVENIIKGFFNQEKKCAEFEGVTLSKTTKNTIKKLTSQVKFTSNKAQVALQEFHNWYKQWHKNNYQSNEISLLPPEPKENQPTPAEKDKRLPPRMQPMEEKIIGVSKVMKGEIKVAPEAQVESLAKMSGENVEQPAQ